MKKIELQAFEKLSVKRYFLDMYSHFSFNVQIT